MIKVSKLLLNNDRITCVLMELLFKKTNMYENSSVLKLVYILTQIMHTMCHK